MLSHFNMMMLDGAGTLKRFSRNIVTKFIIIFVVIYTEACYVFYPPSYNPPPGVLYENSAISHYINTPTDLGNKSGSSCIVSYLGLVTFGNASVQAAAASQGIRTIKALDYKRISVFAGAYTKLCTVVHGE